MVVLAETPEQARAWATDHWFDEIHEGGHVARVLTPTPIESDADVPYDDWLDSHPHAADGSPTRQTVKEMLSGKPTPSRTVLCEIELFEDDEHDGPVRWWRKHDETGEFSHTVALCDHHHEGQEELGADLRPPAKG